MQQLPTPYAWLANEPGPLTLLEGLKLYGTTEAPGAANNPTILGWAKEVGLERVYTGDAVPWCGLFAAVVAHRAHKPLPVNPLWALNWAHFGVQAGQPQLGDVLVFTRPEGGHVGFYVGEDRGSPGRSDACFHVLGGNEGDKVAIERISKSRLYQARRPIWTVAPPPNRRAVLLSPTGDISTDEA